MPRHIKIGLIVLTIGGIVSMAFFINVVGRIRTMVHDTETKENPFVPPPKPLYAPTDPPQTVKVFFPSAAGDTLLSSEDQTVFKSAELVNRAQQILQKVLDGPASKTLNPAVPRDTRIDAIFISDKGTAFIDFSEAIAANHPGGIVNEQATIYSIVDSLIYNLPEIKEVKVLIGGTEKETLAGHILLLLPLQMDLSITDVTPPPEAPQPEGHPVAQ